MTDELAVSSPDRTEDSSKDFAVRFRRWSGPVTGRGRHRP